MMIYLVIFLSFISSILYRAGGLGNETTYWIPKWMRQSWVRDWLCPICVLLPAFLIHPSWWFLLAYAALGGALSTYWKGTYGGRANFWFSGFMCGIAAFPLFFCGFAWWMLLIRAITIAILWGALCTSTTDDHLEEHGRGFIISIASLFFIFLP